MSRYAVFVHVRATEFWLRLSRAERRRQSAECIGAVLSRYPGVSLRYFDAEALNAPVSDVLMFETEEMSEYADVIDALRDTDIFRIPYFEVLDIVPTIEEGFRDYEARLMTTLD